MLGDEMPYSHPHVCIQQQADRICTLSHVFANVLHIITFNLASLSLIVCSSLSICRAARKCLSIENLSLSKTAHHLQLHHMFWCACAMCMLFLHVCLCVYLIFPRHIVSILVFFKQYQTSNFTDWKHDRFLC